MDSNGQDYFAMHFMHQHVRVLLFILSEMNSVHNPVHYQWKVWFHKTWKNYINPLPLLFWRTIDVWSESAQRWVVTLSRGNGENRFSWCPDWNGYARTRHKPLHYLGQALSPGKGKAGSWRQGERCCQGQEHALQRGSDQGGLCPSVGEERWVSLSRWLSWGLISKTAQSSGYPLSRKQSLLSNFYQIPDQMEVKWCQQYFLGWEDWLVQAGKTGLRKVRWAGISYRQFLWQDYLKGGGEKGRQIIEGRVSTMARSLCTFTALKKWSDIL